VGSAMVGHLPQRGAVQFRGRINAGVTAANLVSQNSMSAMGLDLPVGGAHFYPLLRAVTTDLTYNKPTES
jgi:hypothetical protein